MYQSTNNWVHLISLDLQHYSSSGLSFYLYRAHQWLKPFGTGWHCQCQKTTGNALGVFFNTFIKGQREIPNLVISASNIYLYIYILLVFYYIPIVSRFFALKLQSSSAIQHVTNASESQHMFVLLLLQVLVSPRGSDRKNLAWSMWVGLCKGTSYRKPTH